MKVDDQNLPDLQLILGQLQNQMTPQQRAALEKQGITMGGKGIRVCLTPEQVKSDTIPLQDPQSGCKQEVTERMGNQWKFRFSCPKAQGTGVANFLSDREFTTKVNGIFNATGIQQKGSLDTRAVWMGQDLRNGQTKSLKASPASPLPRGSARTLWEGPGNVRLPANTSEQAS